MHLHANCMAIDKPTTELSLFMEKHFQLSKPVNQGNNFVIYEEFFDDGCEFNQFYYYFIILIKSNIYL